VRLAVAGVPAPRVRLMLRHERVAWEPGAGPRRVSPLARPLADRRIADRLCTSASTTCLPCPSQASQCCMRVHCAGVFMRMPMMSESRSACLFARTCAYQGLNKLGCAVMAHQRRTVQQLTGAADTCGVQQLQATMHGKSGAAGLTCGRTHRWRWARARTCCTCKRKRDAQQCKGRHHIPTCTIANDGTPRTYSETCAVGCW